MNGSLTELYNFDEDVPMKKNATFRLITIGLLVLIIGTLVFFYFGKRTAKLDSPAPPQQISVSTIQNSVHLNPWIIDAQFVAEKTIDLTFQVSGALEKGDVDLNKGSRFKKGQLLFQINNREAFAALNRQKAALSALVLKTMPQLELDFPAEKNKWVRFMEELKPQFLVPAFPKFNSSKERDLITDAGILAAYNALQQLEVNMSNYFFIAPFDGVWLSINEQPGKTVRSGKTIATIATDGPLKIAATIPSDQLEFLDTKTAMIVCTEQGDTIGKTTFLKHTNGLSSKTNSTLCYFTLTLAEKRKVYQGMKLRLLTQQTGAGKNCWIPETALHKNRIQLLQKEQLITEKVEIVGRKKDSVLVVGLQNGKVYSTQYQIQSTPTKRYHQSGI